MVLWDLNNDILLTVWWHFVCSRYACSLLRQGMKQICLSAAPSDPTQPNAKQVQICVLLYFLKFLQEEVESICSILQWIPCYVTNKGLLFLFASISLQMSKGKIHFDYRCAAMDYHSSTRVFISVSFTSSVLFIII